MKLVIGAIENFAKRLAPGMRTNLLNNADACVRALWLNAPVIHHTVYARRFDLQSSATSSTMIVFTHEKCDSR